LVGPGPALKLGDPIDQVDDQRVLGARDLGQQLHVAPQLVPRVFLGDLPGDGLRRLFGPLSRFLGRGRGLLDTVVLSDVRQSLVRPVGERAVVFGISQWPTLLGRCCHA
jgi:hypothetical protein